MSTTAPGAVPQAGSGVGLLVDGAGILLAQRRLLWLGMIPPAVTSVLMGTFLWIEFAHLGEIALWLTGFASGWASWLVTAVRIVAQLAVAVLSTVVAVLLFSAITLTIGAPVYDRISEDVDALSGGVAHEVHEPLVSATLRSIGQSVVVLAVSLLTAVPLFLIGLVPVVGSVVAAVGSAIVGGWLVTLELTGGALGRRGITGLRQRHALLREHRWRVIGFGVPTFWVLSIPVVSVAFFPIAVASATLLARSVRSEPILRG